MTGVKSIILFSAILWIGGCATHPDPEVELQPIAKKSPVIARVNGQDIQKEALLDLLYQSHGQQMLKELMLLEMVRQYATDHGSIPRKHRAKNELKKLLNEMAPGKSAQDQKALLAYMLKSRGVSRGQLYLILERQSLLREQIDPNVSITEEMIEEEFQTRHGKRITIRLLTVSHLKKIEQAKLCLNAGEPFSQLTEELSEDQNTLSNAGLLGPLARTDTTIPIEIRQAAFAIKKIGERSPIINTVDAKGRQWWHLLQLEETIAADTTELNAIRKSLTQTIRQQIIKQRMGELQQKIKAKAKTFILDAQLRAVD